MAGSNVIIVGARSSPLSKAQVFEVQCEINRCHPEIIFEPVFIETYGDRDRTTSLRILEKTDFFTREVDDLLLTGACRIAIHSAKDLPDPIRTGIAIISLTHGEDPSDSLVLRQGESLASLSPGSLIATSSHRREEAVKQLRSDLAFVDLRGTIGERLAKIERHDVDGVVIAEAALIRLKMTYLNRIKLPGETVKHQGQLAVVAHSGDKEMRELFLSIDSRVVVK